MVCGEVLTLSGTALHTYPTLDKPALTSAGKPRGH